MLLAGGEGRNVSMLKISHLDRLELFCGTLYLDESNYELRTEQIKL